MPLVALAQPLPLACRRGARAHCGWGGTVVVALAARARGGTHAAPSPLALPRGSEFASASARVLLCSRVHHATCPPLRDTHSAARARSFKSVTSAVGPLFENEARVTLAAVMRQVCPWLTDHSALLSRSLDRGGNAREADIMCYASGDTFVPCQPLPASGVELATLPAGATFVAPLPPAALPPTAQFSPTDATRCGPHKYFIAEVYSGSQEERMIAKVQQLDTLLAFLMHRWEDQHADIVGPVADITALVGAAALVFSSGDAPRRAALNTAQGIVEQRIAACPNLLRLARAHRFLVVVLDKSQSPNTYGQRAVADHLQLVSDDVQHVSEVVQHVSEVVQHMSEDVSALGLRMSEVLAELRATVMASATTKVGPGT